MLIGAFIPSLLATLLHDAPLWAKDRTAAYLLFLAPFNLLDKAIKFTRLADEPRRSAILGRFRGGYGVSHYPKS